MQLISDCLYAAFAIEGQVKEKSNWFSSLRDLTRKLKVRKPLPMLRDKMLIELCCFEHAVLFHFLNKFHVTDHENGTHKASRGGNGL